MSTENVADLNSEEFMKILSENGWTVKEIETDDKC